MAYKIQYAPESKKRYPLVHANIKFNWHRFMAIILMIFAGLWMKINGIPDFLIPGDPDITKQAVNIMVDEIQSGQPLLDAVTVFCHEIFDAA